MLFTVVLKGLRSLLLYKNITNFPFGSVSCGSYKVFLEHGILLGECHYFKCTQHGLKMCLFFHYFSIFFWYRGWFLVLENKNGFISLRHAKLAAKQTLIRGVNNMRTNMCLPYFLNSQLFRNWDLIITIVFLAPLQPGSSLLSRL